MRFLFKWLRRILLALLLLIIGFYSIQMLRRPPRSELIQPLYQGVTYHRIVKNEPRRMMVHVMEIDLSAEGIELFVTPPDLTTPDEKFNMLARKTSVFAEEFDAQVAINASFFYTFTVGTPLTYYPKPGDPITVVGKAMADGVSYAKVNGFKQLCMMPELADIAQELGAEWAINLDRVEIRQFACPLDVEHIVAGNAMFLRDGQPYDEPHEYNITPYGRMAVAVDATGKRVWFILVDNKQWGYSMGATLLELADIAQELGAEWAINLDGGGSSTMVSAHDGTPRVLNSPVHTSILGRERPVANHIGVRALPLVKIR